MQEGSVGHQVQRKAEGGEPLRIQMQYGRRVELQGEELKIWQEKQRAQLLESEPILTDQSIEDLEEELQGSSPAAETLPPRLPPPLSPMCPNKRVVRAFSTLKVLNGAIKIHIKASYVTQAGTLSCSASSTPSTAYIC